MYEDYSIPCFTNIFSMVSDISAWGGNLLAIDILVKPSSLEMVKNDFKNSNIDYKILIPDLQRAIDEENPPVTDDLEELANRQGTQKNAICSQIEHCDNNLLVFKIGDIKTQEFIKSLPKVHGVISLIWTY